MLGAMKQMNYDVGTINVLTFTANTVWVPPSNMIGSVTALLIAGGGGGGQGGATTSGGFEYGGGAGAGGVIPVTLSNISSSVPYTITVGTGGTGGGNVGSPIYFTTPTNGSDTSLTGGTLSGLTASGGGFGGCLDTGSGTTHGWAGGSGGGGATANNISTTVGNVGIAGQGNSGGTASTAGTASGVGQTAGGGGGGGGQGGGDPGYNPSWFTGSFVRNGGAPFYSFITGANVAYAEGGGGAGRNTSNQKFNGYTSTAYGSGGGGSLANGNANARPGYAGQTGAVILNYTTSSAVINAQFLAVGNGGSGASNGGGGGGGGQAIAGNISLVPGQKYYANIAALGGGDTVVSSSTVSPLITASTGTNGSANGSSGGSSGSGLAGGAGDGISGGSGGSATTAGYDARVDGNSKERGGDPVYGLINNITGTILDYGLGGGGGASDIGGGSLASFYASLGVGIGGNVGVAGTSATFYGCGGGGGGTSGAAGGSGATGVVIFSIPTAQYTGTTTGSPTITTNGSNTIITFAATGTYTA